MRLVADVPRQRLRVTGFRFGDGPAAADAWRMWQRNNLDLGSLLSTTKALIAGRAYVIVWADSQRTDHAEAARQCIVVNDPATRLPVAALKEVGDPRRRARMRLFLPTGW